MRYLCIRKVGLVDPTRNSPCVLIKLLKWILMFYMSVLGHCRRPKIFLVLTLIMEFWRQWMKMVMRRRRRKRMNIWMKKEKMLKEGVKLRMI